MEEGAVAEHDDDYFEMPGVPQATAVTVLYCSDDKNCGRPHLVLLDDKGVPFAQAVFGPETVNTLEELRRGTYRVSMLEDDE